jgi:hypothetical protein
MCTTGMKSCLRCFQCTCDTRKERAIPEDAHRGSRVPRNAQRGALVASGATLGNGHRILLTTHQRRSDAAQYLRDTGMSHWSKRRGLQRKLTDFLREFLYPCIVLHNFLAPKKFTRGDLRLCALREFDETLSVPGALDAVKRYDCVVCIAKGPQRMPGHTGVGRVRYTTYPERTSMN